MAANTTRNLPNLLKAKEVGEYLGISNSKLYGLMKSRSFSSVKIGSRYYVDENMLREWLVKKSREKGKASSYTNFWEGTT